MLIKQFNMVRAWFMDSDKSDQRLEHQLDPPKFLTLDELYKITRVEYFAVKFHMRFVSLSAYILFVIAVKSENLCN